MRFLGWRSGLSNDHLKDRSVTSDVRKAMEIGLVSFGTVSKF